MSFLRFGLLAWGFLTAALPALACETAPDISQLPGETLEQARERFEKAHADQWAVRRYYRETYAFEHASSVYVARIVSKTEGNYYASPVVQPSVNVQPVEAIKGTLPPGVRALSITALGSCGNDHGDGDAAFGKVGSLVIVFEGLPVSKERPSGIDSPLATSVRTFELLDPLYKHGKEIPEDVLYGRAPAEK